MLQHHAFLLFGDTIAQSSISQEFKTPSIDVTHIEAPTLSIDDVRALIKDANSQPFESPLRTCVVCVGAIAPEAQHALLKVLEEPPASAQFYFVLPETVVLLSTLRSRFSVSESGKIKKVVESEEALSFFSLPLGERMARIAEKTKEKDVAWIEVVLQAIELKAQRSRDVPLLKAVIHAREAQRSRGSSMKMILEDLALFTSF
jgi:DNA polymerase III delta prime subunit